MGSQLSDQESDEDFYLKLRDDMLQTKQRRFQYQLAKVTSLGSLVGIGALLIKDVMLTMFFYVIPFISFAFDLLIFAESFNLKRMTKFICEEKKDRKDAEFRWEEFVKRNPGKLASIGNYLLTLIAVIGSFIILIFISGNPGLWFKDIYNLIWITTMIAILILFRMVEIKSGKRKWVINTDVKHKKGD